jgi:hypothetical protein
LEWLPLWSESLRSTTWGAGGERIDLPPLNQIHWQILALQQSMVILLAGAAIGVVVRHERRRDALAAD